MMKAVLETNVLVSALLVAESNPDRIVKMALNGKILLCYDSRIMLEYKTVLCRPKFPFLREDVSKLLDTVARMGLSILAESSEVQFSDASDKKFFEVALSVGAYLITGNDKHYPKHENVLSPAGFIDRFFQYARLP